MAVSKSLRDFGRSFLFLTASNRSFQIVSIGLRSGDCGGHSKTSTFFCPNQGMTCLDLWQGALSCIDCEDFLLLRNILQVFKNESKILSK